MKPSRSNQSRRAFTLVEVLVVVIVLFVLAAMILPMLPDRHHKSPRISCVNNLKQVGLAYRLWEGDNGDKFPMNLSVTNGGTMELANGKNAWINFLVMSNQLITPKMLHCPSDTDKFAATSFSANFDNRNISYFVGLDASENDPQAILSGDDNFEINGAPVKSGLLELSTNTPIAWSAARHKFSGNILLADGSVQLLSNSGLTNWLHQAGSFTNRLAIP
jgi:prepilin-type processing-associated H-X9-DG protein